MGLKFLLDGVILGVTVGVGVDVAVVCGAVVVDRTFYDQHNETTPVSGMDPLFVRITNDNQYVVEKNMRQYFSNLFTFSQYWYRNEAITNLATSKDEAIMITAKLAPTNSFDKPLTE